ncbi:MAG TPA: MFS transporter [Candidatus Xenobia bacterium]|jgi:OPA family glycerol-3-phosphate transporter-like MFS transporter
MWKIYRPAPFVPRLGADQVADQYPLYRVRIMVSIFVGYASFYLVRSNFSNAKPYLMKAFHLSTEQVGWIAAAGMMAYGLSKFIMGTISDRSNPRYFMATGLILSGLVNLFFGYLPGFQWMVAFWFLNNWFQGMGWTPCARLLTHWFSDRERGTMFAVWNPAHNVGGGLAGPLSTLALSLFASYLAIFYFPGVIALVVGVLLIVVLRDTPQSVGLPPIEEYKDDYPATGVEDRERELSTREILLGFVLNNRYLWILALANTLVYVVRYGVVNWAATYLPAVKGYTDADARWMFFFCEWSGIPGMLLSGWVSDKVFHGRRAPMSVLYMIGVVMAVAVYWQTPAGHRVVDLISICAIGFLIYGPVMLIGIAAVDLVPKKAAGTAAGFTGVFGYLGGVLAEAGIGKIVMLYGWTGAFVFIIGCAVVSVGLLALTWNLHDRGTDPHTPAVPPAEILGAVIVEAPG